MSTKHNKKQKQKNSIKSESVNCKRKLLRHPLKYPHIGEWKQIWAAPDVGADQKDLNLQSIKDAV